MTAWFDSDYQYWKSTGCDINSAADVIFLSVNGITDARLFKHFVNLRRLNLTNCGLTTIPEEVWELTKLTGLDVGFNSICEISPKIKNLTNLEHFGCRSNIITTFPVEICQLTKLSYFYFADNQLDVLDPIVVDFIRCLTSS